ncbi:arsenate reductase ArsC [Crenobacter caeni]|uniref:Arsenate reductase ArsC n=1 Tax=Crenobacter caeni TaxID=2705474 RepID=A0A6B2KVD2_9NEIS|nr:arsenate reductase ArsC [Crenobacter caeni]NDV14108.1 arsenate reductase ArsC [Crenobacter caeni]
MDNKTYNVLFICTGNSARSIMAESLLRKLGDGHFRAFSAGSFPKGQVHPLTLETLASHGYDTAGLSSKSWSVFTGDDAPKMDFVFTVCDKAAGEACPVWPGQPVTAHWGFADPAAAEGDDETRRAAFNRALLEISHRLRLFLSLPLNKLDRMSLQTQLQQLASAPANTKD